MKGRTDKSIFYANRGVERNKTPLKNKIYYIELKTRESFREREGLDAYLETLEKYKFKDLGYINLYSDYHGTKAMHGYHTPEVIKNLLGEKQWSKFCQGKREFIIQRRVDGKNVSKKKMDNKKEKEAIKIALYKEKVIAKRVEDNEDTFVYKTTCSLGEITFVVSKADMGDATFQEEEPARLLNRYIKL